MRTHYGYEVVYRDKAQDLVSRLQLHNGLYDSECDELIAHATSDDDD